MTDWISRLKESDEPREVAIDYARGIGFDEGLRVGKGRFNELKDQIGRLENNTTDEVKMLTWERDDCKKKLGNAKGKIGRLQKYVIELERVCRQNNIKYYGLQSN